MRKRTAKKAISLLLTAAMLLTMLPVMASALTVSTKPNNGTATGEPFPQGTGGSNSFRIPAMVTLNDGTIVAAADARWNTTYDGGGLDTIVARSSDNGESWSYTFANYLGDNGNVNNASSTAFIDPALAVKTINGVETIFMLVDLYPYGVALNGGPEIYPVTTKGFNDKGKLRLSGDNHSNYGYYLDGTVIKDSADNVVSGLTVDAYFNVSGTYNGTSYDTNLFFSDSPFKVVRTGFLYLTTSTDKGATWSAPTLLDLKTSSERVCLVGPGRGLVTSDGTIVFPVYSYYADNVPTGAGLTQYTGFIYSTDGVNWSRSANFTGASWSSEAAVVELDDGTLRFFYRNGTTNLCYVDYSNGSWGSYVNTGLDTNSNCQISAITYSKTVNGKQVILVSCPAGPNNAGSDQSGASYRKNGKIFIGLVNADKTMSWQTDNTISVPSVNSSDSFMYSCLTEQKDSSGNETGVISILYEDNENAWGTGSNCYYEMSFKTYTSTDLGVTFDSTSSGGDTETDTGVYMEDGGNAVTALSRSITAGETTAITVRGLQDGETIVFESSNSAVAEASLSGNTITVTAKGAGSAVITGTVASSGAVSTLALNDVLTINVTVAASEEGGGDGGDGSNDNVTITNTVDVRIKVGETSQTYTVNGVYVSSSTGLDTNVAAAALGGQQGEEATVQYTASTVTCGTLLNSNLTYELTEYYVLTDSGDYYPLYVSRTSRRFGKTTYYSYTYYYSTDNGTTYTKYGDQTYLTSTSTAVNITVYEKKGVEAVEAYTTVSFTGVSVGETYAIVGSTQYNITVVPAEMSFTLAPGGTTTTPVTGTVTDAQLAAINASGFATASVSGSNITFTASDSAVGNGTFLLGNTNYTITVGYREQTLLIGVNDPVQIRNVSSYDLSGLDNSYATASVTDGTLTLTGVAEGSAGTFIAGDTVYTVTVKTYTNQVMVGSSSSSNIYLQFTIENCTVYYSINGGPLTLANGDGKTEGVWNGNGTYNGPFNITFFAVPDEGYVLTFMNVDGGTTGHYYSLDNTTNNDVTTSEAWPLQPAYSSASAFYAAYDEADGTKDYIFTSGGYASIKGSGTYWRTVNSSLHGLRWALLEGNMTVDELRLMLDSAYSIGADGVTTLTKNGASIGSESAPKECKFVAQKLPEMTKEVTSVGGKPYNPDAGTKVEIGDTIVYTITVYEPVADENYGTITYSNINIQDPLTGGSWTSKGTKGDETTVTINGHTFTAIPYTYTTSLTLTTQNFTDVVNAGTITNVVTFSYLASSTYSSGSVSVAAQAGIHVSVDPSYVVDFGVPLNIDLTELETEHGEIAKIKDPNGKEVTFTDKKLKITTTDAQSFTDIMAYEVELADKDGEDQGGYYITIIPASNVLFEAETFMTASGSGVKWSKGDKATVDAQDGSETDPYGYDGKYAGQAAGAYSAGLAYTASVSSSVRTTQDLTFSFTGTGFDLIGTCGPNTGTLMVRVDNKNGWYKSYMVDTSFEDDNYGTIYQVPLIHAQDWPEGTYTVTIRGVYMGGDAVFGIDAFRVYRSTAEQAYNDAERNAKYYNVLNETIHSADSNGNKTITAYTESSGGNYAVNEYESNGGPQNEIYLAAGQAVAFKVENSADVYDTHNPLVHFSARALDGTSVSISTTGKTFRVGTVASGTEMYYAVTAGNDGIITITNTNASGMLALGNLKLTAALSDGTSDDGETGEKADASKPFSLLLSRSRSKASGIINVGQAATLVPLTEEDQETVNALLSLNSSGDSENTDPDTGDADVNDSDSSGSTGSTGNDDVVILPTPDTSVDAEDEPEDETTDGPQSPYLNKGEAYAYITGFADGTVRPMAEITRAEVATIFYRMLKDEIRDRYWSNTNDFTDVTSGDWYNTAVSTLASLGIVTGNPDGSFNPNGKITRAEFATMAVRFFVVTEEYDLDETVFSDISTSWAAKNILLAYELGLVNGNPDGTFRPGNSITRAEAMTIVNNMLGRKPKVAGLPDEADMITWVDNADKSVWYYAGVQAATNSYTSVYSEEIGGDLWTGVTTVPNWSELEKIWAGQHTED